MIDPVRMRVIDGLCPRASSATNLRAADYTTTTIWRSVLVQGGGIEPHSIHFTLIMPLVLQTSVKNALRID
jgi:hypothetical protein